MNPSQECCEPHGNVLPCEPCREAAEPEKKIRYATGSGYVPAGKAPLTHGRYIDLAASDSYGDEDDPIVIDDEEEEPDLEGYFKRFPQLGPANKIAICRTYASHLAAITRTTRTRGPYSKRSRALSPVNLIEAFNEEEKK